MNELSTLSKEELLKEASKLIGQLDEHFKYNKIKYLFPEEDDLNPHHLIDGRKIYSRHKYKKALAFFAAGGKYKFRLYMAANQVGKTTTNLFEFVCHLIGWYPWWWTGFRFDRPIKAWIVGDRSTTVKNLVERLVGEIGQRGSGMVPKDNIDFQTMTQSTTTQSSIREFKVLSAHGGFSGVEVKTNESGRKAFESETVDLILNDEEPSEDVYSEECTRLVASGGIMIMNFTPLLGMSKVVFNFTKGGNFTEGEKDEFSCVVACTWDDIPHLTEADKKAILSQTPEHLRDARSLGIPRLGAGAVFLTAWDDVVVDPIPIMPHWKRWYAMDFGWKTTAILWFALDPTNRKIYVTNEYYVHHKEPIFHAQAIQKMNMISNYKIPGTCDPAAGPSQSNGVSVRDTMEKEFNLVMEGASKEDVEADLFLINHMLSMGQIGIFNTCPNFKQEYKILTRNEKGDIIGEDHACDCFRYGIVMKHIGKTSVEVAKEISTYNSFTSEVPADGILDLGHRVGADDSWLFQ